MWPHCASGHKTITITIKTNERQIFSCAAAAAAIKARAEDARINVASAHYLMAVKVTVHDTHRERERNTTQKTALSNNRAQKQTTNNTWRQL